jgi:HEAT repeats
MAKTRWLGPAVALGAICCAGVAYHVLDLREPRRTRSLLSGFRRGELEAWDEYKMDPPRTTRAVPALLEGMRDANPTVRERAVVGVCGLSADPLVLDAVRSLASDADRRVKEAALHCLQFTYHVADQR